MRGAIHPLPQYAFMAWCSVKKSTGTTLMADGGDGLQIWRVSANILNKHSRMA
jgi:hypothetical protein